MPASRTRRSIGRRTEPCTRRHCCGRAKRLARQLSAPSVGLSSPRRLRGPPAGPTERSASRSAVCCTATSLGLCRRGCTALFAGPLLVQWSEALHGSLTRRESLTSPAARRVGFTEAMPPAKIPHSADPRASGGGHSSDNGLWPAPGGGNRFGINHTAVVRPPGRFLRLARRHPPPPSGNRPLAGLGVANAFPKCGPRIGKCVFGVACGGVERNVFSRWRRPFASTSRLRTA
jgi:hypothetical protein